MPNVFTDTRLLRHLLNKYIAIYKVGSVRHTSICHKMIKIEQKGQYHIKYDNVSFNCNKVSSMEYYMHGILAMAPHTPISTLARLQSLLQPDARCCNVQKGPCTVWQTITGHCRWCASARPTTAGEPGTSCRTGLGGLPTGKNGGANSRVPQARPCLNSKALLNTRLGSILWGVTVINL